MKTQLHNLLEIIAKQQETIDAESGDVRCIKKLFEDKVFDNLFYEIAEKVNYNPTCDNDFCIHHGIYN